MSNYTHQTAPTQFVEAAGMRFAYRRFANRRFDVTIDIPLFFFMRFTGTMDHWDPELTDGFVQDREVILFNNAGLSNSSGEVPTSIEEMAQHAAAFVDALGIKKVDALGFSIGGLIAQQFTMDRPDLVRKLILVGTSPGSGEGIVSLTPEAQEIFGARHDPADELGLRVFFTPSERSQAAGRKYPERQRARKENRDPFAEWKDRCGNARGERQQRRDHLYGALFDPAAKPAERAVHSVPRQQSWCPVPVPQELFVEHVTQFLTG
jgi:pimeloyl-ACP methyl ester carboxylesterase